MRSIVVIAFVLAVVIHAEAQTRWQQQGVTFTASEGRVLYAPARSVRPGEYYFTVRVTIARDAGASPENRVLLGPRFQFVSEDGGIYHDMGGLVVEGTKLEPCQGVPPRYLMPGSAVTCDLIFGMPTNVTRGTVEITPPFLPPVPITIRG